jgi:ribonuclease-3
LFFPFKHSSFRKSIYRLTGVRPIRIRIYLEAFTHSSASENKTSNKLHFSNNERLEFLGDAILDALVAEILFKRFPHRDEGFLTEMRTRIVNRDQLSDLAHKLGLIAFIQMKPELQKNPVAVKSIGGNALEALIGAIYLDRGYKKASWFIRHRLIGQYLDIDKLMSTTVSHKAVFLKWAQKNQKELQWIHIADEDSRNARHTVSLSVDGEIWFTEINKSRKRAEELCCEKACRKLNLSFEI